MICKGQKQAYLFQVAHLNRIVVGRVCLFKVCTANIMGCSGSILRPCASAMVPHHSCRDCHVLLVWPCPTQCPTHLSQRVSLSGPRLVLGLLSQVPDNRVDTGAPHLGSPVLEPMYFPVLGMYFGEQGRETNEFIHVCMCMRMYYIYVCMYVGS